MLQTPVGNLSLGGQLNRRQVHAPFKNSGNLNLFFSMGCRSLLQQRQVRYRHRKAIQKPQQIPTVLRCVRYHDLITGMLGHARQHALESRAHVGLASHPPLSVDMFNVASRRKHQNACRSSLTTCTGTASPLSEPTAHALVVAMRIPRTMGRWA